MRNLLLSGEERLAFLAALEEANAAKPPLLQGWPFKQGDLVISSDGFIGSVMCVGYDEPTCLLVSEDYEEFDDDYYDGNGKTLLYPPELLAYLPKRPSVLSAAISKNNKVIVTIQNCSRSVDELLCAFDIFGSDGRFECSENEPFMCDEHNLWETTGNWLLKDKKVQFECPIEFWAFINSSIGRTVFERMGVDKFILGGAL